ncbi:MAG TPA: hypothetical protein VGR89_07320, partial [Puia sp.]|nr:hypothetical protein [Puia sp.]
MRMNLLVIVPTRSRPRQVKRLVKSFEGTTDKADLLFVIDGDDSSYKGTDWHGHGVAEISPRATLTQKLNKTVANVVDNYDAIMWLGDDHEFITEHWDTKLLDIIAEMGSGWVYPNNGRRVDVAETWLVTSDVTRELGYFANPI